MAQGYLFGNPLSSNKLDTDLQKHTGLKMSSPYQRGWDGAIPSWAPESTVEPSFSTGCFLGLDASSSVPERGEISKYIFGRCFLKPTFGVSSFVPVDTEFTWHWTLPVCSPRNMGAVQTALSLHFWVVFSRSTKKLWECECAYQQFPKHLWTTCTYTWTSWDSLCSCFWVGGIHST